MTVRIKVVENVFLHAFLRSSFQEHFFHFTILQLKGGYIDDLRCQKWVTSENTCFEELTQGKDIMEEFIFWSPRIVHKWLIILQARGIMTSQDSLRSLLQCLNEEWIMNGWMKIRTWTLFRVTWQYFEGICGIKEKPKFCFESLLF